MQLEIHVESFPGENCSTKLKLRTQASHTEKKTLMFIFTWPIEKLLLFSLLSEGDLPEYAFFFFLTAVRLWAQAWLCLHPIVIILIIFNIFGTADYTQIWLVSMTASHSLWNNHLLGLFYFLLSAFLVSIFNLRLLSAWFKLYYKAHVQINFSKHEQLRFKHSGSHKIWYAGIFSRLSKLGYNTILWKGFRTAHKNLIFWFAVEGVILVSSINTCISLLFSVI